MVQPGSLRALGVAYRLNDKTVIRTGGGIYYLPSNLQFSEAPWGMPLSSIGTPYLGTLDGGVTLNNPISNPFPNGFLSAPGNLPARSGAGIVGRWRAYQHSTAEHQLSVSGAVELYGAAANSGEEWRLRRPTQARLAFTCPLGTYQLDSLSTQYLSQGNCSERPGTQPVLRPGQDRNAGAAHGYSEAQLLLPFPQYTSVASGGGYLGHSTYHSLQMKVEKRMPKRRNHTRGVYVLQAPGEHEQHNGLAGFRRRREPWATRPRKYARRKIACGLRLSQSSCDQLCGRSPDRQGP